MLKAGLYLHKGEKYFTYQLPCSAVCCASHMGLVLLLRSALAALSNMQRYVK